MHILHTYECYDVAVIYGTAGTSLASEAGITSDTRRQNLSGYNTGDSYEGRLMHVCVCMCGKGLAVSVAGWLAGLPAPEDRVSGCGRCRHPPGAGSGAEPERP